MVRPGTKTALRAAAVAMLLAGCRGADPYQGLDAEGLHRMAETEYAEGDYANAVDVLERLVSSFGDWPRIAEARLLLADSYYADGDYLTARSEYQRFRDRFVGHAQSAVAALGQCRALAALSPHPQRDQGYTTEAITICGNVAIDYDGTPQASEAREVRLGLRFKMAEKEYLNAHHYFRRKQYDPAIIYFQFVVDLYPETEFAPRALMRIYESNLEIGYDDLASDARELLLRDYSDSPEAQALRAVDTGS